VHASLFSNPNDVSAVDYTVLSSNGSGRVGLPQRPANERYAALLRNHCQDVFDNLPRDALRVNALRLSNSGGAAAFHCTIAGEQLMDRIATECRRRADV
jgi:hypothetical protein